jgi:hypothetical protein
MLKFTSIYRSLNYITTSAGVLNYHQKKPGETKENLSKKKSMGQNLPVLNSQVSTNYLPYKFICYEISTEIHETIKQLL